MIYIICCTDRPDSADLRRAIRPTHRDYLRGQHEQVKVVLAGATLRDDNKTMSGSLVVVEAESAAEVELFAERDPYRQANLFERWEIRAWDWTLGNPAGDRSINPI